jgi:hypothetical protein
MKFLAILGMISGLVPTLLILRIAHSNWADLGLISAYAIVPNLFTGLVAYAVFREPKPGLGVYKALLGVGYVVGIAGGVYFYHS